MQAQGRFDPANPGETDNFGFDFARDMATVPGDTIAAVVSVTLALADGTDPNPDGHLTGDPQQTGTQVLNTIQNLVAGCIYVFSITIRTTAGRILTLWQYLPCKAVPPPSS
jgi:hypothetical protein